MIYYHLPGGLRALALIAIYSGPILGLVAQFIVRNTDPNKALDAAVKDLMVDSLQRAGITHKEACALMHIDQSQWSKILSGQLHTPSVTRLLLLPWAFWQTFIPGLVACLTKYKIAEICSDHRESCESKRVAS